MGLAFGLVLGLAYLVVPLTLLPGLVVLGWLLSRFPRLAGLSGAFVGFGLMWLALIGQVTWTCANDPSCVEPNATFWLAIGAVILLIGLLLGMIAWWERQPR